MDERTVELACDALYEFFKAGILNPNSKKGEAVQSFVRRMEETRGITFKATQDISEDYSTNSANQDFSNSACVEYAGVPADVQQLNEALDAARQEVQELRRQLEASRMASRQAEQKIVAVKAEYEKKAEQALRNATRQHEAALKEAQASAQKAESRAQQAERQLEAALRSQLPEQAVLTEAQDFLNSLSPELNSIFAQYFDTGSLTTFLVQCGQFSRINQLWEACGKSVTAGRQTPDMADGLIRLLQFYNRAAGENPATLVEPAQGDVYKSAIHYRVTSDGSIINKLLLPGLRNPAGKVQQNALVELR